MIRIWWNTFRGALSSFPKVGEIPDAWTSCLQRLIYDTMDKNWEVSSRDYALYLLPDSLTWVGVN
jgi:hypothetical protein